MILTKLIILRKLFRSWLNLRNLKVSNLIYVKIRCELCSSGINHLMFENLDNSVLPDLLTLPLASTICEFFSEICDSFHFISFKTIIYFNVIYNQSKETSRINFSKKFVAAHMITKMMILCTHQRIKNDYAAHLNRIIAIRSIAVVIQFGVF